MIVLNHSCSLYVLIVKTAGEAWRLIHQCSNTIHKRLIDNRFQVCARGLNTVMFAAASPEPRSGAW
jgi:hypothetical protein